MHAAVVILAFAALGYLALDHVELLRRDDGFVVALHIVLGNLALVDLRLLGEIVDN